MKFRDEAARIRYEDAKLAYEALMKYYPFAVEDLDGEEWLPVADKYHVSNYGRIKSLHGNPKILKPALIKDGYLQAFIPNPLNKPEVNHDDGHKLNCTVGNLIWATSSENTQHAYDTGLKVALKGTEVYNSKLTAEQVLYIRENPDGLTTYQLAEKFGVAQPQISRIQLGKTYKNEGGNVRKPLKPRIPDEIRNQIRAKYSTGNFSQRQLARQFGVSHSTIRNIIHESQS